MSDFLPVNQLDFSSLRENLKTYLQGQSRFADYDFEGSNISVLLDILAFNTYQNAFYLNMIGNEMFLDTATLRDSVISHAKELNYLPRSYTSAAATVRVNVNVTNNSIYSITVPQYYKFTATTSNGTYTFSTAEPYVINRNANNQFVRNIDIYEGVLLTEKFVVNTSIENQRFLLSNPSVDTDSIEVFVHPTANSSTNTEYTFTSSVFGLNANSTVFYIQPAESSKYEVQFGDNVISKKPAHGNMIAVKYRVSLGAAVNGASSFSPQTNIDGYSVTASTVSAAAGGAENESLSSIKFNATRFFQTQDRLVTKEDYRALILANFPEIKSISVYGGEELIQNPQYGRVILSCVTQSGDNITQTTADRLLSFVKTRSPLAINPQLETPEYLDLGVTTNVRYNSNLTTLTDSQVSSLVANTINNFNNTYLIDFKKTFRYSKLVSDINNTHASILSNETTVVMAKTIIPLLNENYATTIDFNNAIERDDYNVSRPLTNEFTLYSSSFTYNSRESYFGEDGAGKLFIFENTSAGRNILKTDAGTVDYENGIVNIATVVIADYSGDGITFTATPRNQDITSNRNTVIRIDVALNNISSTAVKE